MNNNYDSFKFLKTISIEIGPDCNLKKFHNQCPAHHLQRDSLAVLSNEKICEIMDQAITLEFDGHFAFHFYNEPLLYIERIYELKKRRPNYKFLLWSNGTLVNKVLKDGYSFDIFDKIVFTKYNETNFEALYKLKSIHKDVQIYEPDMDNRLEFYDSKNEKYFSCKKVYIELPIDCYGNVYICTFDWNKKYLLGNVLEQSLESILKSRTYQNLLIANEKRFQHGVVPLLCKYCPRPYIGKIK